jgi:hypothetical protein
MSASARPGDASLCGSGHRRCCRGGVALVLALAAIFVGALPGAAQEAGSVGRPSERATLFEPVSGPPGTQVHVRGYFLPAITPVHVALGGTRTGFEALSLSLTTRTGDLEETVFIPEWARRDRAHRFIIFDAYFSPLSTSGLFHVTGPDGSIIRTGVVESVNGSCVVLQGEDGEVYTLSGELTGSLDPNDRVEAEGRIRSDSPCGEGVPIQVTRIQRLLVP